MSKEQRNDAVLNIAIVVCILTFLAMIAYGCWPLLW